jgi:hypothetical protein
MFLMDKTQSDWLTLPERICTCISLIIHGFVRAYPIQQRLKARKQAMHIASAIKATFPPAEFQDTKHTRSTMQEGYCNATGHKLSS